MKNPLHQNLLDDDSVEAVKKRLETTLGNIKFQKGQVFWDDIEKLEHCIKALENVKILQDTFMALLDDTSRHIEDGLVH